MLVSDDRDTVLKCGHMKWTSTREKGVGQNRRTDRVGWKGRAGARNDRFVLTIFGAILCACMFVLPAMMRPSNVAVLCRTRNVIFFISYIHRLWVKHSVSWVTI